MDRADQLAKLLIRWEELAGGNQVPPPEEICRDCPELLADFREMLQFLVPLGALGQRRQAHVSGFRT